MARISKGLKTRHYVYVAFKIKRLRFEKSWVHWEFVSVESQQELSNWLPLLHREPPAYAPTRYAGALQEHFTN